MYTFCCTGQQRIMSWQKTFFVSIYCWLKVVPTMASLEFPTKSNLLIAWWYNEISHQNWHGTNDDDRWWFECVAHNSSNWSLNLFGTHLCCGSFVQQLQTPNVVKLVTLLHQLIYTIANEQCRSRYMCACVLMCFILHVRPTNFSKVWEWVSFGVCVHEIGWNNDFYAIQ